MLFFEAALVYINSSASSLLRTFLLTQRTSTLFLLARILKYFIGMQHESDELIELFFQKGGSKSSPESSKLIKTLFESPAVLLSHLGSLSSDTSRSGIDVAKVQRIYECIAHSSKDNQLLVLINNAFNTLVSSAALQAFLKSSHELKYFFVVFLWERLFTNPSYEFLAVRLLEYLERVPQHKAILASWIEDLPPHYFRILIKALLGYLEVTCKKLVEKEQTETGNKALGIRCETYCYCLSLLFESNRSRSRVPLKQFHSSFLVSFFQPLELIKIYIGKGEYFNFVKYAFLLDFEYKYKLLQIESVYEQKINIKKNMDRGLAALIHDFDFAGGNFSIEGLIYLCIAVRRTHILDDSMEKLGKIKTNLRSPLRIEFVGEEGTDEGGVKNEYFALLTKAIFNPLLDMFVPRNNAHFYWFNGFSYQMPIRFEFVGMLLGLALYNGVHLDIHFPEVTFRKLLNEHYDTDHGLEIIEDLKQIEPQIYRSLKDILTTDQSIDELELYFTIQLDYFGEAVVQELVVEGRDIKVTRDNREQYCLLYADFLLNKHIEKQFHPFRKGFYRVVGGSIVNSFEAQELSVMINGKEEINIKELEESASYEGGYTPQTPVIRYLWDFLHTLTQEDKKNFMTFVTGTDRVPIEGLKALNFKIQRHSNTTNLPTAHTCFNVLLLPEYESRQKLQKNMRLILEHNQGFGLI